MCLLKIPHDLLEHPGCLLARHDFFFPHMKIMNWRLFKSISTANGRAEMIDLQEKKNNKESSISYIQLE